VGTHGGGVIGTLVLGSVAEQVLRHATCPVLTIGPDILTSLLDHERFAHVLFATDFSDGSMHALPYALSIAKEHDAELTLMQVLEQLQPVPMEYSKELLSDYRKRLWELVPEEANPWCKPPVTVAVGSAPEQIKLCIRLAIARST
jgi:nucleotide-binding universal stress UspA family protein